MPNFIIVATKVTEYEIRIRDAKDEQDALASLDHWLAEDFERYVEQTTWDFDVLEDVNE